MAELDLRHETAGIVAELGFQEEIGRLQGTIEQWIADASGEIQEELRWQFMGSSKFYRPLTVFACYRAVHGPRIPDTVVRSAVAVELFHNMSLIIDDILDRSRERRGKATLHCRFGKLPALMTSGYVVADGYRLVIDDPSSIELLSELMKRLGVAECIQWRLRRKPLGVEDWRMIAGEDTGSMFEVCACLGARSEQLRQFGHLLGLLYHGCDDVADVRGLQALGGGGMEDVRDGILTLPAALAIRDPEVAEIFVAARPGDEGDLLRAFEAQVPAAERYLDAIRDEARKEAELFSEDATDLLALVDKVRRLSSS
ncbi:MAG: polyprenyl synthetase family protein [Myxococcota bacterium]|nr:polyprenyl synthetase family protein [Myxococcota bacterium]